MKSRFQLAVVGSGFGGSLLAMAARRIGLSVVLIERARHPRFAIGESSTPLANLLLEEIADEFELPFLRSFSKWGSWQKEHPEIACGLKRGFTFYRHELGQPFPRNREEALKRQLLVGASPNETIADTHWFRAEFDAFLVEQAKALGVEYLDETELEAPVAVDDGLKLVGRREGKGVELFAEFLVDASGPRGFLHRSLGLAETEVADFPATQAVFSHFEGVGAGMDVCGAAVPPYPPEQAAVHHVFDEGWIWVLRFNSGITSAGVVATDAVAERFQFRSGEAGWRALLKELPSVAELFASARAARPFSWQPRVAFQSAAVADRRWTLLPSAVGALDPLLSTGFPLTLLGVQWLARLLRGFGRPDFSSGLEEYAATTTAEFEATARLVGALYRRMDRFEDFKATALLYFAAASFSETVRRLGKAELAPDFLLRGHPRFGPQLAELCETDARGDELRQGILAAIEPIDVAGLTEASRDPWYPAAAQDLFRNAAKVGASREDIEAMLLRCGFEGTFA